MMTSRAQRVRGRTGMAAALLFAFLTASGCARQTRLEVRNISGEDLGVRMVRGETGEPLADGRIAPGGVLDVMVRLKRPATGSVHRLRGEERLEPGIEIPVQPGGWTSVAVHVSDGRLVVREWRRQRNNPF